MWLASQLTDYIFFQVFEYETIIKDAVDIHYPINEMVCNSKIRFVFCLVQSSMKSKYSQLSLSRLRLSRITAYLEEKSGPCSKIEI